MPRSKCRRPPARLSHLTLAKLLQLLLMGPCSVRKMQEWTGLSRDTLYRFMNAMCAERAAHIVDWEDDAMSRPSMPVFKLGLGENVPRRRVQ